MNLKHIQDLLSVIEKKNQIDKNHDWSEGSSTYFEELKKELKEVEEELASNRQCYLEDELADVFWDYLNLLYNLQDESKINMSKVFERALGKYKERIDTISNGGKWDDVKKKQKLKLKEEQRNISK